MCEQGTTFRRELVWLDESETPVNLSGYSARMQVRASHKTATTLIELSSGNGRLIIDPTKGKIFMVLSATVTATFPAKQYVYDLEIESNDGEVLRLLEGSFTVSPEVTR